jgi:hypothetical protein
MLGETNDIAPFEILVWINQAMKEERMNCAHTLRWLLECY